MRVSKNLERGVLITKLDQLVDLAKAKKSVYHNWWGLKPAAVIIRMQMYSVLHSIESENLFKVKKR